MPVLQVRVDISSGEVDLRALCAGYELAAWRDSAMVEDVFDRHLLTFALNYSDSQQVSSATAIQSVRDAAVSVYTTDKYGRRGEFGELLLHAALIDFYGAEPAVSKIYYEDSSNEVVKGFDSVHVVPNENEELDIWLGEAKFYEDLDGAMRSVLEDVQKHLAADFLRKEFMFIGRKVDASWPRAEAFMAAIARSKSLDEIAGTIVMPVFLTYNSDAVNAHSVVNERYVAALEQEAKAALESFERELRKPLEVKVRMILVPLKDKKELIEIMHAKLRALQAI